MSPDVDTDEWVSGIRFPGHQPGGAMISVPIALAIHRYNIQEDRVFGTNVESTETYAQCRKHASKTKLLIKKIGNIVN